MMVEFLIDESSDAGSTPAISILMGALPPNPRRFAGETPTPLPRFAAGDTHGVTGVRITSFNLHGKSLENSEFSRLLHFQ